LCCCSVAGNRQLLHTHANNDKCSSIMSNYFYQIIQRRSLKFWKIYSFHLLLWLHFHVWHAWICNQNKRCVYKQKFDEESNRRKMTTNSAVDSLSLICDIALTISRIRRKFGHGLYTKFYVIIIRYISRKNAKTKLLINWKWTFQSFRSNYFLSMLKYFFCPLATEKFICFNRTLILLKSHPQNVNIEIDRIRIISLNLLNVCGYMNYLYTNHILQFCFLLVEK